MITDLLCNVGNLVMLRQNLCKFTILFKNSGYDEIEFKMFDVTNVDGRGNKMIRKLHTFKSIYL